MKAPQKISRLAALCDDLLAAVGGAGFRGMECVTIEGDVADAFKRQAEAKAREIFEARQVSPELAFRHFRAGTDGFPHDPSKARAWADADAAVRKALDFGPLFSGRKSGLSFNE